MRKTPNTIGLSSDVVIVTDVVGPYASVKDGFGKNRTIRADVRRGGGRKPRAGETWLVDRTLGDWTFAALYEVNEISFSPVGSVTAFAGEEAPTKWMICDGAELERESYPELFEVIGTTYGSDDDDTFEIPDLRQRFPVGAQEGGDYDLGDTGGAASVTLALSEIPSHAHSMGSHIHTMPSHSHTISHTHDIDPPNTNTGLQSANHSHTLNLRHGSDPVDVIEWGLNNTGSTGTVFVQVPAAGLLNQRSTGTRVQVHASMSNQSASHSHAVNIAEFTSGGSNTASTGSVDPGDTNSTNLGNTGSQGSGDAHENRPPFLALNFIICVG